MLRPLCALAALAFGADFIHSADDVLPGPPIEWPEVKGLDKQKPNIYKDKDLGYSVSYLSEGIVITVFVYNLGLEKIPTGPNADAIKAEMYESLLALEANRKNGRYKSITPVDERVIPFGTNKAAPELRRKRYEVEVTDEGEAVTELYVTGYKNYFLKIRATYPSQEKKRPDGEKAVADVLSALGKALK